MNLMQSMTIFRRVAETDNFSEVAREFRISQPTVSKHVAALEKHLNAKLINRSTRQLSLTEAGNLYYSQCVQILDLLSETESLMRNQQSEPAGTIRISTPVTFGELNIVPHMWEFLNKYPDLSIDLITDDHYIDLIKEGVDIAIRVGSLTDSGLIARKIGDSPRVTVASSDYLAKYGEPESINDLRRHNCIVYSLLSTRNIWHFTGPRGKETVQVSGRFSVNNPRAISQAVLAGQGIAVTPIWLMGDYIEAGQAKVILNGYIPTPLDIHALYPDRRFVPAKIRIFIDYIREKLEQS